MAKMISSRGDVSPVCAGDKPKKINLANALWTNRADAVTCQRCIDAMELNRKLGL